MSSVFNIIQLVIQEVRSIFFCVQLNKETKIVWNKWGVNKLCVIIFQNLVI